MPRYFFDAHMHAMNLAHPNFIPLVESISDNLVEFLTSGALSPEYLLTAANRGQKGFVTLLNMFSVFERPIGEIFALMEQDLSGAFRRYEGTGKGRHYANLMYPDEPYIRDGKFHIRSMVYDRYALIPLVMDFSQLSSEEDGKSYYTRERQEKILGYAKDTLDGIAWYRDTHPDGILEFFPFIGINPEVHTTGFIGKLLETYVRTDASPAWDFGARTKKSKRFRGIKFYPPLGTDPWPKDERKREKVELIYRFCESNGVPIITHCDDQGFRGIPVKLARKFTAPSAWAPVLEQHPRLRIDFAHYGRQYSLLSKSNLKSLLDISFTDDPWFTGIIDLMARYDHVYADFSFSGTDPQFYEQMHTFIYNLDDGTLARKILDHSMFGSDFAVNLGKVESYTNYLRIFESSPFTDEDIDSFVSTNPTRFLGLVGRKSP